MKKKTKNNLIKYVLGIIFLIVAIFGSKIIYDENATENKNETQSNALVSSDINSQTSNTDSNINNIKIYFIDQTTPIMIQSINARFVRNPLITVGI